MNLKIIITGERERNTKMTRKMKYNNNNKYRKMVKKKKNKTEEL